MQSVKIDIGEAGYWLPLGQNFGISTCRKRDNVTLERGEENGGGLGAGEGGRKAGAVGAKLDDRL